MKTLAYLVSAALVLTSLSVFAAGDPVDPDKDYDRLDGTGQSGKTVQVIEWEGNLEIHVYPKGSLKGLALKMDRKNKDRQVMVIGYRFDVAPKQQLIRRNILGIPIWDSFKVYKDNSADDYDKIIISNNVLAKNKDLVAFQTDPEPTQMYPDGHPSLAAKPAADPLPKREPAAGKDPVKLLAPVDEEGRIRPFEF